jgi:glucose/arabinose dehydrogenase
LKRSHLVRVIAPAVAAFGLIAGSAAAANPPLPTVSGGGTASLAAVGPGTPTAFAFGKGQVFVSDGTLPGGGVDVIKAGVATKLPGSPIASFGVAWHKGTLYVSALAQIQAWSGWNGTSFTKKQTIFKGSKQFPGLNGLAFGGNGRLYVGVDVGQKNDHGPATAPYQYDVLSMTTTGHDLKIVAQGIRQPWQFAFPAGSSSPFVSDLGQDSGAKNPPDFVLRVKPGQNYGFPKCNHIKAKPCRGFAKPWKTFAPHSDVMGLAILGKRLYMTEFGAATPQRVVSVPLKGGHVKTVATGFTGPVVGLGARGHSLYVGQVSTGQASSGYVFKVTP